MIADSERLLLKIFYDYYVRNLSQNDIALRHRISRKKVQRFLEKGREDNLVEVKIRFPSRMHGELESALEDKYDLLEALVADVDTDEVNNRAFMIRNVSDMAADYFLRVLTHDMTVSVTWSAHVAGMLDSALRKLDSVRERPKNVRFVLTLGAVIGSLPDLETLEATRHLASALNGDLQVLMAPNMTTSSDVQKVFMDEPQISSVMDMARNAEAAFFGIGAATGDSRQMPMVQQLMPEVARELVKLGAVGDINGRFFDAMGNPVASELDRRMVGLSIQDIRSMPLPVGIATGPGKYEAIKAILTGRVLKVLVTDVENARRLVAGA
jgi:Transcriptional regulator, contains sigma factor-related N-terminal domain